MEWNSGLVAASRAQTVGAELMRADTPTEQAFNVTTGPHMKEAAQPPQGWMLFVTHTHSHYEWSGGGESGRKQTNEKEDGRKI